MSRLLAKLQSVSDLPQNIAILNLNESYAFLHLEINASSPHGPALIATVNIDGENTKVYLPARYAAMLSAKDIADYNKNPPLFEIVYKGMCGRAHNVIFQDLKR